MFLIVLGKKAQANPTNHALEEHHFPSVEEEVACNEILPACGRELVLEGNVLVPCQDATQQRLGLEVLDKVARHEVVLLPTVVARGLRHVA